MIVVTVFCDSGVVSCMPDEFSEELALIAEEASEALTEQVREEYLREVSRAEQGADGLEPFVSDVSQQRDSGGRFSSGFKFEVNHPFAKLHERGGHIEPSYATAQARGWERDEMYRALTDCNELVRRKSLMKKAMRKVRRQEGDD